MMAAKTACDTRNDPAIHSVDVLAADNTTLSAKHSGCGSHPDAPAEISKFRHGGPRENSGGARAGAGRKPKLRQIETVSPRVNGLRWYCAATLPRGDLIAIHFLCTKGYRVHFPLFQEWSNEHNCLLSVPCFPGYLFVEFDRSIAGWGEVVYAPGVRRLLGNSSEDPTPLPLGAVETLISKAGLDGVIPGEPPPGRPDFASNQVLKVTDGPFTSFVGIYQRSVNDRISVLLDLFGRSTVVELNHSQVRPA